MKKYGRKVIICEDCGQKKLNGGFNKCSACLRKMKRQTRPIYYLRTCWGEIKRRCTQLVPNRTYSVYGKEYCTKEEFVDRFLNDESFLKQYQIWQESDYKRGLAPSIDRIDNTGDYRIENLQFLSNIENSLKDSCEKVEVLENNIPILCFYSQTSASKHFGISGLTFSGLINNQKIYKKKYTFRRIYA